MTRLAAVLGLLFFLSLPASAAVVGEEVAYGSGGITFKGYVAWDDARPGKRPGVLVVHEWWGHNAYARKRARMLAELGYTALAVDMYGGGRTAAHPKDAGAFARAVGANMDEAEARFRAALETLGSHATVTPGRIAAIGYCFGGGIVLEMARRGVDLKAVASFHGSLTTANPAVSGKVKGKILVANGAEDPLVKPEHKTAFKAEMEAASVDYSFIDYPGALHSFTNPDADRYAKEFGLPLAYDKEADARSWQSLVKLLRLTLGD